MSKGGGGDQVVRQESLPEYAEPYVTSIMQRAESESYRDYQPYGGERLAGTAPETGAAYDLVRGMGPGIPGLGAAQQMTGQAAMRAGQIGQQGPSQFNQYGYSRMGPGPGIGGDLTNYQGAFGGRQPRQYGFQNVPGSNVGGQYRAGQARGIVGSGLADFRAPRGGQYRFQNAQASDVGGPYSAGQASRFVGSGLANFRAPQGREYRFGDVGQFTSKAAEKYMSPYMQNVVDVEKDRAQLDFERAQSGRDAAAVQAGAFGGSRGAVENALAQEALGRRQGEIQATGQQSAYEDAQRMFGADREAQMRREAERAGEAGRIQDYRMQGAGLQAETQMGAQRLASQLYGGQQQLEQAAFEGDRQAQMLIDQQRAGEFGRAEDYRMQGANLQAQTQMDAQRLASQLYGSQQQLEQAAFEGDRQAKMLIDQQRAGEFGRTQELGAREVGSAAQQRLAAQQAQADIFDRYRSQDFAGQQAQAAELARVQAARDASRLGFGELGLSALGQQGQLAGQLGELGGRERDAATQYAEMLQGIGGERQAEQQRYLDLAYQDFLAQQQYPMEQLQAFNDIVRGNIRGGSTTQQQFTQANPFRDLLGAGITGLSLANMGG